MARKTHDQRHAFRLDDAARLLKQIEEETLRTAESALGNNWEENLLELFMTRMEISVAHKETLAAITPHLRDDTKHAPRFAASLLKTMHRMLYTAKAPASPLHTVAMAGLYTFTIDTFLQDTTPDLSKTMAAVDKQVKHFASFCRRMPCHRPKPVNE